MNPHLKISIPKPCHESWDQMTPKDKGRFCQSCSKVVIDFSKMSSLEIEDYLESHKHQKLCGRFKQSQLDSIHLQVPLEKLNTLNIQKVFLIALLLCLGTTLFSCTNHHGQAQKIDSIELIDNSSKKTIEIDSLETICKTLNTNASDSIPTKAQEVTHHKNDVIEVYSEDIITTGAIIIATEYTTEEDAINLDELELIEDSEILGFPVISEPPKFKNTPPDLSVDAQRSYFSKQLSEHMHKYFDTSLIDELDLKEPQHIRILFDINTEGFIENIRLTTVHPALETELIRILNLIPQLMPGRQRNNAVVTSYALPFIIDVDEE